MQIVVSDIINHLESIAPSDLAEEWDNVGLLAGEKESAVNRVLVALDITSAVIDEAVKKRVDLVVSHHPVIFKPLMSITDRNISGRILLRAIRSSISIYCMHTNYDVAENGLNDVLAKRIGLVDISGLNETPCLKNWLGRVGYLEKETQLGEFAVYVKEKLGTNTMNISGELHNKVKKVAVFCGAFDGDVSGIKRERPDVLLTGEIKYHHALELAETALNILQAGHYHTEKLMERAVAESIREHFPGIETMTSIASKSVFRPC